MRYRRALSGLAFPQAGGFTFQTPEVVQLGAAYLSCPDHSHAICSRRRKRHYAIDCLAKVILAERDGTAQALVILGDNRACRRLQPFLVSFLHLYVLPNRIAGPNLGMSSSQV